MDLDVNIELNYLLLYVSKTKELVLDFRRSRIPVSHLSIRREMVEMVQEYKHLSVCLDYKLDWTCDSVTLYWKGHSQLFLLQRLQSFAMWCHAADIL